MVSAELNPNEVTLRRSSSRSSSVISSMFHAIETGWKCGSRISRRSASLPLLLALFVAATPTPGQAVHVKTLDGARYDINVPGTFSYLKSGRLQVQASMSICNGSRVSCINGVAIAYGGSLVRFSIQANKLVVARGSSGMSSLAVFKSTTRQDAYRVFLVSDRSSYVDVVMGTQQYGSYIDVNVAATPFIKRQGVDGFLGNGNGNPADDVTDQAVLANRFKISSTNNLFTCVSDGCQFVPLTAADKLPSSPVAVLQQGFTQVDVARLPVSTFKPN